MLLAQFDSAQLRTESAHGSRNGITRRLTYKLRMSTIRPPASIPEINDRRGFGTDADGFSIFDLLLYLSVFIL